MSLIRLHNVAKRFDSKLVFRDVFFRLSKGDRVGLIGKNGVGKTTVLKLIIEQEEPTEGTVEVNEGLKTGYFSQFSELNGQVSIVDVLEEVFADVQAIEEELIDIEIALDESPEEDELQRLLDKQAELLEEMECDSIKIASADLNHWPLIRRAARTGMCIQVDTGNATIGEIEEAVDIIRTEGKDNIIIHNCPSGYPARLESINLNLIPTMKRIFPYPVGFSDHTPGWDMDIAAVALGANLVEKTITENRMTRSVEHIMSLEPHEMKIFIRKIRALEIAMGDSRRILHPAELEKRKAIRRSAFLKEAVTQGQSVVSAQIEFRRPGHGIGPNEFEKYMDRSFVRDLPAGHMCTLSDFQ